MSRRPTRFIAAALLLVGFSVQAGDGFPSVDPARELVVYDGGDVGAVARGDWSNGRLVSADPVGGMNYWLPSTGDNWLDDGMVRARVDLDGQADFSIVLRGSVNPENSEELNGYGVSLAKDTVAFHRWDHGITLPMGPEVKVKGISKRDALEVVVFLVGPQIAAFVYDATTLEELASMTVHDTRWSGGQVGVRSHATKNGNTRVTHLAVMGEGAGWWGEPLSEDAPFGEERLVIVPEQVLPGWANAMVVDEWSNEAGEGRLTLYADKPIVVDRLRRAGVEILEVSGDVPWFALDSTYREQKGKAPTPRGKGFALDLSYKDHEMVEDLLRAYHEKYPAITRLEQIATTSRGNPVWALRVTDYPDRDENEPAVIICSAHHGSELLSIEYSLDALDQVLKTKGRWVSQLDLWFVPLVNPDGNHVFMSVNHWGGRKNGRETNGNGVLDAWDGVDLNRNYPFQWGALGENGSRSWDRHYRYRGEEAGSEIETKAMMALANELKPAALISFHTNGTMILSPYTIDGVKNVEPDPAWAVAEEMVELLPVQPNGRRFTVKRKMYSVDGTDQDWHYWANGTIAYIVEGSHHNPIYAGTRKRSIEGLRPLVPGLLDRLLDGPGVTGFVKDEDGNPLQAVVTVDPIKTFAGEQWTARADGRYDRMLPEAGAYIVRATLDGYKPAARRVNVEGREFVNLTMVPE